MAIHAAVVWEARAEGNNNNSGGWHDVGGASVDHSQQDAANEDWSNLSISGTTLTDDDAGGNFAADMVGNIINILTKGRFEIDTVTDGNNVELDSAPGDGNGLTGYEGGAVANLGEIDSVMVLGNVLYVKAGSYNEGAITFINGNSTSRIEIIGYNSARGDNPRDDNKPLLIMGANAFNQGNYNKGSNLRMTITHSNGYYVMQYGEVRNVEVTNTGVNATDRAFRCDYARIMDCDAICGNGRGFYLYGYCTIMFSRAHDCNIGIYCYTNADFAHIEHNIIKDCVTAGIFADGCIYVKIIHNNFKNCDKGIDSNAPSGWIIRDNQFTSCPTYGVTFDTQNNTNWADANNWFDNGDDVNKLEKGPNATAKDPDYAGEDDFSGVDDSDATVMLIGVGA